MVTNLQIGPVAALSAAIEPAGTVLAVIVPAATVLTVAMPSATAVAVAVPVVDESTAVPGAHEPTIGSVLVCVVVWIGVCCARRMLGTAVDFVSEVGVAADWRIVCALGK